MRQSQKFALDVTYSLVSSLFTMATSLIVSILLGRMLGAGELGIYRMTMTLFNLIIVFVIIGLPSATTKFIADYKNSKSETNQILSAALILFVGIGILTAILLFIFSGWIENFFNMPGLAFLLQIIVFAVPLRLINFIVYSYLTGSGLMKWRSIFIIIESITMLILSIGLVFLGYGAVGAVIAFLISLLLNACLLLLRIRVWKLLTFSNIRLQTIRLVKFGVQVFLGAVVNEINYQADTLLIGYFSDEESVGFYTPAKTLSQGLMVIPNAVEKVTYPAISEYWKAQRYDVVEALLQRSVRFTGSFLYFLGLIAFFFAEEAIFLLYTEAFEPSIVILQILLIGIVANGALSRSIGGTLAAINRPDIPVRIVTVITIFDIVIIIILMPMYGIAGAAIATMLSFILRGLLGLFFSFHYTNSRIEYRWLIKSITFTLLFLFLYYFMANWIHRFFLGILLAGIHILIVIWIFLTSDDRKFLLELVKETSKRLKESFQNYP
ncbi:MAG: flippase [Candidatus Hermodarchaeota archaeon]